MTAPFRDEFSSVAAQYALHRPVYPRALFDFIATLPARRALAWDCATGNGQAARALAPLFTRVIATDASDAQLAHATPAPNIEYRVARAEASGVAADSVDLVTVAQAMHWFELDTFFDEVRRVVRVGGALAVWGYGDGALDTPALASELHRFYSETVGAYWPPARRVLDSEYRDFVMPFTEVSAPRIALAADWTLAGLGGYVRTWSATQRYIAANGRDPVDALVERLRPHWGEASATHRVTWPLWLRCSVRGGR